MWPFSRRPNGLSSPKFLDVHSTRLFPKCGGPGAYKVSGIAARCDWVVFSDGGSNDILLHQNKPTDSPRHVFLSLRNPFISLAGFVDQVLPRLSDRFVLVSGSEDATLPYQCDQRWRAFNAVEQGYISAILDHPLLIRWFAENLDDDSDRRFAALPTGMVFPDGAPRRGVKVPAHDPLGKRQLRVLCTHREREGPQWETRRLVSNLARTAWAECCTVLDEVVPEKEFLRQVESHAFVLCVEGGGLDPSPKAWQTILHGAIPIIRETGTRSAYAELPVAFVSNWNSASLSPPRLAAWRDQLASFHDDPAERRKTIMRLGIDHWWSKIEACRRP